MNKMPLTHRFVRGLHLFFIAALLAGLALAFTGGYLLLMEVLNKRG